MFRVLSCLGGQHDLRLVALAAFVCFISSIVTVSLFQRARSVTGHARVAWIVGAGAAGGFRHLGHAFHCDACIPAKCACRLRFDFDRAVAGVCRGYDVAERCNCNHGRAALVHRAGWRNDRLRRCQHALSRHGCSRRAGANHMVGPAYRRLDFAWRRAGDRCFGSRHARQHRVDVLGGIACAERCDRHHAFHRNGCGQSHPGPDSAGNAVVNTAS